jgi:hypothetical protein
MRPIAWGRWAILMALLWLGLCVLFSHETHAAAPPPHKAQSASVPPDRLFDSDEGRVNIAADGWDK